MKRLRGRLRRRIVLYEGLICNDAVVGRVLITGIDADSHERVSIGTNKKVQCEYPNQLLMIIIDPSLVASIMTHDT